MGKFLDSVSGQSAPRSAADQDPIEGGDALDIMLRKREALEPESSRSNINASPKFSTGPRKLGPPAPTKPAK